MKLGQEEVFNEEETDVCLFVGFYKAESVEGKPFWSGDDNHNNKWHTNTIKYIKQVERALNEK